MLSERKRPFSQKGGIRASLPVTDISYSQMLLWARLQACGLLPFDVLCDPMTCLGQWNSKRSGLSLPTRGLRVSTCFTKFSFSFLHLCSRSELCVGEVLDSLAEACNVCKKYTLVILNYFNSQRLESCLLLQHNLAYFNYNVIREP